MVKKTSRNREKQQQTLTQQRMKTVRAKPVRPSLWHYTLIFLYKNLYILGITLLRYRLRLWRRIRLAFSILQGSFFGVTHRLSLFSRRTSRNLANHIRQPFQRIRDAYILQQPAIRAARRTGENKVSAYLPVVEAVGRLVWRIIATILNHGVPIVALIYLITTISTSLNTPVALYLKYDEHDLGYVQNEAVFDEATQIVRERVFSQNIGDIPIGDASFKVENVKTEDLLDSATIADMIIQMSGDDIEQAYGLYINNVFLGAVTDPDPITATFDRIKAENTTGKTGERVAFEKSIRFNKEWYPASSLIDTQELVDIITGYESASEYYTVQEGDTPTEIADKTGVRYQELLQLNPTIEDSLMPGMELETKVARPYLSVKNIYTDTYLEEIEYETVEVQNATYARGYREVTQEGVNGERWVVAEITAVNGQEVSRTIIDDSNIIRHPVDERVVVGVNDPQQIPSGGGSSAGGSTPSTDMTPAPPGGTSTGFRWPTSGGRATTYSGHTGNGVDIAVGPGVPIYASASGTVAKVVNGYTGYGHYIIIDHGNGYQTLYAHNSANYVSVGDKVAQGQVIAAMGRTGWATGNHVHFEVRYNGRYMWPPDFIGYSG